MTFLAKHVKEEELQKVAKFTLPKDITEWNEKILGQFFTEVDYLPKEVSVDISISALDEEEGYAKGSVIVATRDKYINFPVIVEAYDLSPFDTFVKREGDDSKYIYASKYNVSKALHSDSFGDLSNLPGNYGDNSVKRPGGITPKQHTTNDMGTRDGYLTFDKTGSAKNWKQAVSQEDFDKFASTLVNDPELVAKYFRNSGDTIMEIVDEVNNSRELLSDDRLFNVDAGRIINRHTVKTLMNTELLDPSNLNEIRKPCACDVYAKYIGSVEDALDAPGVGGTKLSGGIFKCFDRKDYKFISNNGNLFVNFYNIDDEDKKYGIPHGEEKSLVNLENVYNSIKTSVGHAEGLASTGYTGKEDKVFQPNPKSSEQFKTPNPNWSAGKTRRDDYIILFKNGDTYELIDATDSTRRMINGVYTYTIGNSIVVIPSAVTRAVKAEKIDDPVYRSMVGACDSVIMIPLDYVAIPKSLMTYMDNSNLLTSDSTLDDVMPGETKSILVKVGSKGYQIYGDAFEPLKKVAGLEDELSTRDTMLALETMGLSKEASKKAVNEVLKEAQYACEGCRIYGVVDNYIDGSVIMKKEASERINSLLHEYALSIRKDLTKEASELEDPEAVDVVLSLNFINGDNLKMYMDYTDEFKDVSNKLSELLISSRMGLKTLDEGSIKKSIEGIESVIEDLNNLRFTQSSEI